MLERSGRTTRATERHQLDDVDDGLDLSRLWRPAAWGGAALLTLIIAVIAGGSETGSQRMRTAMGPRTDAPSFATQAEARRLSDELRRLAADRDRLQSRLASLERGLEDVTGSVVREIRAVRAAASASAPAMPAPQAAPIASMPPLSTPPVAAPPGQAPAVAKEAPPASPAQPVAPDRATLSKTAPAADVPLPRPGPVISARSPGGALNAIPLTHLQAAPKEAPAPAATAIRTEFGVDIGSAATMEALRAQWQRIKQSHPKLLDDLRPLASIRDITKRRTVELHLVAGPLADAGAAARLCASLVTAGLPSCHTAVFEGQRLAIR